MKEVGQVVSKPAAGVNESFGTGSVKPARQHKGDNMRSMARRTSQKSVEVQRCSHQDQRATDQRSKQLKREETRGQ